MVSRSLVPARAMRSRTRADVIQLCPALNLVPRVCSSTIFKMAETIRHFENRRGESPGDEVAPALEI